MTEIRDCLYVQTIDGLPGIPWVEASRLLDNQKERNTVLAIMKKGTALATLRPTSARTFCFLIALLTLLSVPSITSAAEEDSATELAKKTQNPVSDLISVPFESNFNFNTGAKDATVYVLNVQPIIPIHLSEDWNLIIRTIMPIINQPSLFPAQERTFGLGDMNPSFFFSPAKAGRLLWGIGPTFTLPTATDSQLGSDHFSMGLTAVALTIQGPWLGGVLVANQWSITGWGDKPSVNRMLIEPFVNYNFGSGWHLTSELVITADWEADAGQRWTVPIGGGVGKLFTVGKLPVDTTLEAFWNIERPDYAPDWQLRFRVTFLLPASKR